MNLDDIINRLYRLPDKSRNALKSNVEELTFTKGYVLLKADKVEKDIYFIKKGIVRAYTKTEDKQVTFWFGKEGDTILSLKSYIANQMGYENIQTIEDCTLYRLDSTYLRGLFETDLHLANFGRCLAEQELLKAEERLISMQFKSAQERYEELVNDSPELLQRVSLGHLASYLGISQVSLSRIRANFK